MTRPWWSRWTNRQTSRARGVTVPVRPRRRPRLELLEDRITPNAFSDGGTDLAVLRVDTPGAAASKVWIDEFTSGGSLLQSVDTTAAFPATNTHKASLTSNPNEGRLDRSPDRLRITYGGYDVAPGGSVSGAARVVNAMQNGADVTANGIDTKTTFTNANGYTGGAIQGAATYDGQRYWTAGTGGNNGVRIVQANGTTSSPVSPLVNTVAPKVFNYQLYAIVGNSIDAIGPFGSPPTAVSTATPLPGVGGLNNPHDFVFMDRDAGTPGVDTLYVADDSGMHKFAYDAAAQTWVDHGLANTGLAAGGVIAITTQNLTQLAGSVDLFVINGQGAGNQVLRYTDTAAFNVDLPSNGQFAALNPPVTATGATAGEFLGLAFTPLTSGNGNFNFFPTATVGNGGPNYQTDYLASLTAGFQFIVPNVPQVAGGPAPIVTVNDTVSGNPNPPLTYMVISISNPLSEDNPTGNEFLGVNLKNAPGQPGDTGPIAASYVQATHTLVLSGPGTVTQYRNALNTLSYQNANDNPNFFRSRVVTIQANDGKDFSAPVYSVVRIFHQNVAPTVVVPPTTQANPLTTNEVNNNTNCSGTGLPFSSNLVLDDVDGNSPRLPLGIEQIAVTVDQGATVTLGTTAGVTIVSGANGSGAVTISGTLAGLATALNGLTVLPTPYFRSVGGDATTYITMTLAMDDEGHTTGNSTSTLANPNSPPVVDLTHPLTTTRTVLIRVLPVDAKPVLTMPPGQPLAVPQNSSLTLSGATAPSVLDQDSDPNPLQVTITATQGTVTLAGFNGNGVPGLQFNQGSGGGDAQMTFQGTQSAVNAALNGLIFTPSDPTYSGPASVRIFVNDLGNTGNCGPQIDDQTATFTIQPVNLPPQVGVPGPQSTSPKTPLKFSQANGNPIVVSDPNNPVNDVMVTLTVSAGTIKLGTTAGLTTVAGDGTSTITFTAPLNPTNLVDQALDGLTFTPPAAFTGNPPQSATLTVTVNDQQSGGGLLGGPQTGSGSVSILVAFPNQPPVLTAPSSASVRAGATLVLSAGNGTAMTVDDPDAGAAPIQVILSATAGTVDLVDSTGLFLVRVSPSKLSATGSINDLNAAFAAGVTYTAPATAGNQTLTVTADDLGSTGAGGPQQTSAAITITVTPPPVVFTTPVATADFYTTPNRTALTVPAPGVLVNDAPGVGPAALTAQLLSGPDPRSGTLSLNPDGSFVFVPAANFNGNAVFVYQANNGAFLSAPVAVTVTVAPPVITPGGTGLKTVYATGAAAGGGPQVNEYDGASGALIRSFFAYDPAFLGGVRVATGDVNGDGVPDIVTAAGPGGGPHVKVFDGRTGALLLQFFAYDSGFTGGVFVAIGDVNGDGQADIITGAGAGGGPHVKAFDGATGAQVASFFAYTASFTGGVTVASGDVNGDGVADIITGAGAGGGPHVKAFSGGAFNEIASFFAYNPGFTGGVFVTAGDVMGFGRSQIITGPGFGGGPDVKGFDVPTGQTVFDIFAYNPGDTASSLISSDPTFQYSNGVTVTTTSLGNDKRADLVVAPAQGLGSLVRVIDGASLNSVRDFFAYDPSFLGGAYVG